MKTLVIERNVARFAAARVASAFGTGRGAALGPLRLTDAEPPAIPSDGWQRVSPLLSGICGSDLATIDGRSSRYFEDLVSFPFVPGHEVVGTVESGERVVVEPVLSCAVRGIEPLCPPCAAGRTEECERVAYGHLRPGLQTGFCADTGGGWSAAGLVAHPSQLHAVPEMMSDEDAVTVEPMACAVHAAVVAGIRDEESVAVLGAGTLGLLTIAALRHLADRARIGSPGALFAGARYAHQRRLAVELGADEALDPGQLPRAVRRKSRSFALGNGRHGAGRLTGGADVVFDCVGSAASLEQSLAMVRPGGRVVLVGMPGPVHLDLAPLWHREVALFGSYAYGTEHLATGPVRTFALAIEAAAAAKTGRLVTATYPLERFEEAVAHAGAAGRRGAVKIAFDLRESAKDLLAPMERKERRR